MFKILILKYGTKIVRRPMVRSTDREYLHEVATEICNKLGHGHTYQIVSAR